MYIIYNWIEVIQYDIYKYIKQIYLEVFFNGGWQQVCGDYGWGLGYREGFGGGIVQKLV